MAKKWQNMKIAGDVLRIVTVGRQEAGSSVYFAQQVREECKLGVQNNLRRAQGYRKVKIMQVRVESIPCYITANGNTSEVKRISG
jgi:nitrogen regulatory protein PII-like uncharacterized protein